MVRDRLEFEHLRPIVGDDAFPPYLRRLVSAGVDRQLFVGLEGQLGVIDRCSSLVAQRFWQVLHREDSPGLGGDQHATD